jgi:hypothetical protein
MTRDELIASILGASSPKPQEVEVSGLGAVYVRVMTAFDADQTRKQLEALKKDDGCETGRLLACILTDESGSLLFDVGDSESVLKLAKLPPAMQTTVIEAANRANGVKAGNA